MQTRRVSAIGRLRGQARTAVLRLRPLPGRVPDDASGHGDRGPAAGRRRRSGAGIVRHGRSNARYPAGSCAVFVPAFKPHFPGLYAGEQPIKALAKDFERSSIARKQRTPRAAAPWTAAATSSSSTRCDPPSAVRRRAERWSRDRSGSNGPFEGMTATLHDDAGFSNPNFPISISGQPCA